MLGQVWWGAKVSEYLGFLYFGEKWAQTIYLLFYFILFLFFILFFIYLFYLFQEG